MTHDEIIDEVLSLCKDLQSVRYQIPTPYPQGHALHIQADTSHYTLSLIKHNAVVATCDVSPAAPMDMEIALMHLLDTMERNWTPEELDVVLAELGNVPTQNELTETSFLDFPAGTDAEQLRIMLKGESVQQPHNQGSTHERTVLLEADRRDLKDLFTLDISFDNGMMANFLFIPGESQCSVVFGDGEQGSEPAAITDGDNEQFVSAQHEGETYIIHLAFSKALESAYKNALKRLDPAAELGEISFDASDAPPVLCLILSDMVA